MAEKAPPRRRSASAVKQEMQATIADVQKEVQERREASATPEQRIEERNVAKAIEGSSNFKSLTSLQQLLSDQGRKSASEK